MKLTFPSIMYSTKFLGGLRFCLRWGGGGSLETLTRYYNYLFMYVVSSRILAFWCCFVLTHRQQSRVSAGPDGFFQDQLVSTRSVLHKSAISLLYARGRMGHAIVLTYFKHAEIYA